MSNGKKKLSFLHQDTVVAASCLPPADRCQVYEALHHYQMGIEPTGLSPIASAFFNAIKPIYDNMKDRYNRCVENGRKGAEHGVKGAEYGKLGAEYGRLGGRPKKTSAEISNNPPQDTPQDTPLKKEEIRNKKKEIRNKIEIGGQNKELISPLPLPEIREIVSRFNAICDNTPKVCRLSASRINAIRRVVTEMGEDYNSILETVFLKIKGSKFLGGANPRKWVLTFDYLFLQPDMWLKIYEGQYDETHSGDANLNAVWND